MRHLNSLETMLETAHVGAKAASLSQLVAYGVSVPKGFAISKEVLSVYNKTGALPVGFMNDLKAALAKFNSPQLIIRSSAIGEDSDNFSFAGQLDSLVVDNQVTAVEQAIYTCWQGLKSDRLSAYETQSGKQLSEMGVVIQEFIQADYAGVTFTQSPHHASEIYTEYVQGAGEQLVSGRVNPESFGIKIEGKSPKGLPFNADELIQKSLFLKDKFAQHLDIEWVAVKDQVYFVQARPITVQHKSKVHWSNTNLNENYPDPISPLLYSIATDSYYHYFKNLAKILGINSGSIQSLSYDFNNIVGIWGNRIYYNMTSIHNILSCSPIKGYFKNAFNKFIGYENQDVSTIISPNKSSLLKLIFRSIILNMRLDSHVKKIEYQVSNFTKKAIQSASPENNKDTFYAFLDLRFNKWYRASLADFFAMIHYKALESFTKRFYGKEHVGVHNQLIQAIPGLISSEPLNDIYDISQKINTEQELTSYFLNHTAKEVYTELSENSKWKSINDLVQNYLSKWGFRCSGELMFFKKNYIEEPSEFIALLQSYLRQEAADPRLTLAIKAKERRNAMRKFALKILIKRHVLIPLSIIEIGLLYLSARMCKQAISSRERVRYKQAEMYYHFKKVILEIGKKAVNNGIIKNQEDLFYLKYKEIGELISSDMFLKDIESTIKQRKVSFKKESLKTFPEHFTTLFGERPETVQEKIPFQEGAKEFEGLAASGGRIKARVKVLDSVLESHKLKKGDILVTKQTDPGWAMVFPLIGGLVVERGGALSHGAIVAREFGIPAVIGIQNISKILKDNDEIILDGDLGKIQLL